MFDPLSIHGHAQPCRRAVQDAAKNTTEKMVAVGDTFSSSGPSRADESTHAPPGGERKGVPPLVGNPGNAPFRASRSADDYSASPAPTVIFSDRWRNNFSDRWRKPYSPVSNCLGAGRAACIIQRGYTPPWATGRQRGSSYSFSKQWTPRRAATIPRENRASQQRQRRLFSDEGSSCRSATSGHEKGGAQRGRGRLFSGELCEQGLVR